jgi:hypothetical protein
MRPAIGAVSAMIINALAATPEMKDAVHPNSACQTGMTNPNVARVEKATASDMKPTMIQSQSIKMTLCSSN